MAANFSANWSRPPLVRADSAHSWGPNLFSITPTVAAPAAAAALAWMAPQGTNGVQVLPYDAPWNDAQAPNVVIEASGCEAPPAF